MDSVVKSFVEKYQCPGCGCGGDSSCYEKSREKGAGIECGKHTAGTIVGASTTGVMKIFLGLPTGFNHLGPFAEIKVWIFLNFEDGWGYNKFNVPVWKFKDDSGNTIVRGISPRTNVPFLHIFTGDCLPEIDCLEIVQEDIDGMD